MGVVIEKGVAQSAKRRRVWLEMMDTFSLLLVLLSVTLCYSSTNAQLLTVTADDVTVLYNTTAVLECVFTVNTTYDPLNNNNGNGQKVNLTIGEIERTPPLQRTNLPNQLTGSMPTLVLKQTLHNVLLADEGLFTCSAMASITGYSETKMANFTLSIKDYYTLILSLTAPNVLVMHNSQAVLNCTVETNKTAVQNIGSDVVISIIKADGSAISDHTQSYDGVYNKVLVIQNAQSTDSGMYQCIARIGEEEMVHEFSLVVSNAPSTTVTSSTTIITSMTTSVSPSPSPTQKPESGGGISETLLLIIIIAGIVGITAFVLLIVACYFVIANVNLVFCYKTDEMRMEEMDGKMNRNSNKLKSLYDQELGEYANNDAYDVNLNEEEIFEAMEEEHRESWYEYKEKKKIQRKKQIKKKKRKGSFVLESASNGKEETDFHKPKISSNRNPPTFADELHRHAMAAKQHEKKSKSSQYWQDDEGGRKNDSDPEPYSVSDQSDYSNDDDDDEDNSPRVPKIVYNPDKSGRIRRSSLQGTLERPKLKKKVSMGSVEVLDDKGDEVVPRRIDFNDVEDQDDNNTDNKKQKIVEKETHPSKKHTKEDPPTKKKTMDDVMMYLDDARKPPPVRKSSLQELSPTREVLPPSIIKPTLFRQEKIEDIPTATSTTITNKDKHSNDDTSFFPWRRSSSVSIPKISSDSKRPRRASIGSKPNKKSKGKLYGGTASVDVFY